MWLNKLIPITWDTTDWCLSIVTEWHPNGTPRLERALFSLKCWMCHRFSWGCPDHWFCGLCAHCKSIDELVELEDVAE